jgi:hypothetical protein
MKKSRLLYSTLLGLVLLFGCKKEDPEKIGRCGVKDPTTELPWLKKEIEKYRTTDVVAIGTTIFKKERVFWIYDINSSDGSALYKCDGTSSYLEPVTGEEKEMRALMGIPTGMCPYLVWATSDFKKSNCN